MGKNINRKAQVAGRFYPANAGVLKNELARLFEQVETTRTPTVCPQALIVPHAGYVFSGQVAASAYGQIPEGSKFKRIFIIASSHRFRFEGAAVYTLGNYETPLGEIEVDKEPGRDLLRESELFTEKPEAHEEEHSLEVQLPFLQYRFGKGIKLVPIIMGTNKPESCKKIANTLKSYFTRENLFVISTDFSHYPEYKEAYKVDEETAKAICSNQPQLLLDTLEKQRLLLIDKLATSLCGWTSVLTLLYLTQGEDVVFSKIAYQNSGDVKFIGDKESVVGYCAISVSHAPDKWVLPAAAKQELLAKARNAIRFYLKNGKRDKISPPDDTKFLTQKAGAFVSVYVKGELRGCIGAFADEKCLNEVVQEMAVAAIRDKRFDAISAADIAHLQLEISVLTPLKQIASVDEIELGKHGIYIKSNYNTGTYLPQVAERTDWSVEEFLGHCARDKARIGWDGWKTAELYTYEAVVIKDE